MLQRRYDIIIVGAGPAGLIAAIESHKPSRRILVLEKMQSPALKLKISGKGRCNITNSADLDEFISHFGKNGRFLRHAFAEFFNTDLLHFFEKLGVRFKLERGGRYFPRNDNAKEIAGGLLQKIAALKTPIATNTEVTGIAKSPGEDFAIHARVRTAGTKKKTILYAANVVLATGGKSYPGTGSTGMGYKLAAHLGHTITPIAPSLVPLETGGDTAEKLRGLSLRNVNVSVRCDGKKVAEKFGEMLFTDSGVSGPIILSLSRKIVPYLDEKRPVSVSIDLKPALSHHTVERRLLREINMHGTQHVRTLLKGLLPARLVPVFLEKLDIPGDKKSNQLRTDERKKLRMLLKEFELDVTGYRSFDSAIVTSGGVSVKEINPQTMESKLVKGLYLAGEIIDVDADTGGFNLQAAFSTGWLAGRSLR